jgi:DNA-binding transcriptional LysR family regulator
VNIDFVDGLIHPRLVLNLHHLELFYYVAKAGGITASLRQIPYGIQQPAVSAQLVRLEESLGTKLFQRRPFSLTPAGRDVYETIAPFFGNVSRLASKVRAEADQHLRLAASASVLREHLPELLKQLADETPTLRITLREADQVAAEKLLREHEVDLAVTLLEGKTPAGLRSEVLLKVPMVLMVQTSSRFRNAAEVLKAHSKEPLPLVSVPPGERLARLFQDELGKRGIHWPVRLETSGLDLIGAYVSQGFGVGLGVELSHRKLPDNVHGLTLRGFPSLVFGALWSGRLPSIATRFLELARVRAAEISMR